ncbi:MAG: ABC transporter ATP-binding protein [Erysipelotrichales bacterium]|nr:ABC transporter ATP-binding protein [Erysipelotrichales bacterium]
MNIEVNKLNKSFDEFTLSDISIKLPKGKIVGLIGENGAGKTTLIKCILNVMHKDSGEVKLFGHPYDDALKENIGVVFDDSFLNETFTIMDINLIMKNIYKKWDSRLFFKYIKSFKIPKNKEIKKLSTGMKKKIEIASCISRHPRILILDEPTSGLDPVMRSEVLDMFQDFVSNNENSILLSTHITSDLEHIADDVIFISNGKLIFDKPLKEVKDSYVVLELTKDEFKKFNKKDIIRYKENRLDYQVLINKKNMKSDYKKYIKDLTRLDDIMLLYIRGQICED